MAELVEMLTTNMGSVLTIIYLLVYAIGLKLLTPIVFRQLTVSKTYVSMTKKDSVLALLWFAIFLNAVGEIIAYLFVPSNPSLANVDFAIRTLVAVCVPAAGYMTSQAYYDFF